MFVLESRNGYGVVIVMNAPHVTFLAPGSSPRVRTKRDMHRRKALGRHLSQVEIGVDSSQGRTKFFDFCAGRANRQ